jgi:SAM-dependent methyltransferase
VRWGAFGSVLEPEGHEYVGVDSNPDMIRSARDNARKTRSSNRFILGDVRSAGIEGRFDTVTLPGNALCHFDTADFLSIITNVERNVQARSCFVVDYRDVVSLLFAGKWARRFSEKRGGRTVTSLTKGIDTEQGILLLESVQKHGRNFDFTHGVWSPFIIEPLMRAKGWRLARRYPLRAWKGWLDVYEKE